MSSLITNKKNKSNSTVQSVINTIMSLNNGGLYNYIYNSFYGYNKVIIVGGAVYKHKLRNEETQDIDVVCHDSTEVSKMIKKEIPGTYHPSKFVTRYSTVTNYAALMFKDNDNLHIDFIGYKNFTTHINDCGFSMTNSLVLDNNEVKHVLEVNELKEHLLFESENPKLVREWLITKIKNKEYCKSSNLRDKDKNYFKNNDWNVIEPGECARYGIFNKN